MDPRVSLSNGADGGPLEPMGMGLPFMPARAGMALPIGGFPFPLAMDFLFFMNCGGRATGHSPLLFRACSARSAASLACASRINCSS
jgi:hypothetical protein